MVLGATNVRKVVTGSAYIAALSRHTQTAPLAPLEELTCHLEGVRNTMLGFNRWRGTVVAVYFRTEKH